MIADGWEKAISRSIRRYSNHMYTVRAFGGNCLSEDCPMYRRRGRRGECLSTVCVGKFPELNDLWECR